MSLNPTTDAASDPQVPASDHHQAATTDHDVTPPPTAKLPLSNNTSEITLLGIGSPGVRRIEVLSQHFRLSDKVLLFIGLFLVAYAYGLDGLVRVVYTATATSHYQQHSLLSTINVVRAVIAAAAQPTAAKLADVFGRVELVAVSCFFYVLGTIVVACATGVKTYCAGTALYQVGYTVIVLMVEVIIADVTSLRSRVFFSYIPAAPFIINTWISGNITSATLDTTSWRWGIAMFAIIYPVCALPLIFALYRGHRRAKKTQSLEDYKTPFQMWGFRQLCSELFWQLDFIGVWLVIIILSLILIPFTVAGGEVSQWQMAKTIVPLVIGFLCIPVFIVWEMKCKHPMIPFHLLKDRGVWGALGVATMLNFAWYLQGDYLYTVLIVSFNGSINSATRITSLYSFVSVVTGIIVGLVIFKVRRLKIFVVAGTVLFLVAFGLLISYRGGTEDADYSGIIGAEVLLGIAGGLFPYTTQASIQAATKHEHVAVVTGLYLACYNIGSALGNTVSGAIWTQILPGKLKENLPRGSKSLAGPIFADPLSASITYGIKSPIRRSMIESFRDVQLLLCISGMCLCIPLIVFSCVIRNPVLGEEQSLDDAERDGGPREEKKKGLWAWLTR